MDLESRRVIRDTAQHRRCAPRDPVHVWMRLEGTGDVRDDIPPGPADVFLEVTNIEGELAGWFDDIWWTDAIERWADHDVTLHITPTADALLHPVILHNLGMARRVVPNWRIVGHAYADDVIREDEIELLAGSTYHEVRFTEAYRTWEPGSGDRPHPYPLAELFSLIRKAQTRLGATTPILTRLASDDTGLFQRMPSSSRSLHL